ncbi:phosphopantetheine-binding protein [Leisingera sp. NJS204]|uniref:phosphopantetheine-binding protein n=1 Tax=Leisingera sp. NJS204 TaxID=2508307 RepID=UPI00197EA960|nr:phosphopantetheine-binding protein [Leisingera sp. NJS204]
MTCDTVLEAMRQTLAGPLANPHMQNFSAQAVLNDDLHIDSVILINLMLHLETDHGIEMPERKLSKDDFATVDGLIRMLLGETPKLQADTAPAPSEITVHCFVSCLCAAIRRH